MSANDSRSNHRPIHRILAVGLIVAAVFSGCAWVWLRLGAPHREGQGASERPASELLARPARVPMDFAGTASCRVCHPEIWERYQTHPMAHSMFPVLAADPSEDYTDATTFVRGDFEYRVERRDDGVIHHEIATDADGETIYDQPVAVQYALGSGKRGRSYLIERGGLLFMSPISWYSEKRKWDLSPSYPERGHQRFERRIVDRCISCHVGEVAPAAEGHDRYQQPPFREMAIGCERCHGPAQRHIAWQAADDPLGDDPIVNPRRLSPSRRDSVCNQCHLQGTETVPRYGRGDFDFRPGMALGEVWTVFVEGSKVTAGGQTAAVSQVEQMQESLCYRRSDGRLGCISCHDPHSVPGDADRETFYREKCLECHDSQGCRLPVEQRQESPAGNSCMGCHMPRLAATDIPHTTQTDHRILRSRRISDSRRVGVGGTGGIRPQGPPVFDSDAAPLSEIENNRALGIKLARAAEQTRSVRTAKQAIQLLEPVYDAAPDDSLVADALAVVRFLDGQPDQAAVIWRTALDRDPANEGILLSLALQHVNRGEFSESRPLVDRLVQLNPLVANKRVLQARVLDGTGEHVLGLQAGQQALELNPSLTEAYFALAEACSVMGDDDAARHYRTLLRRLQQQK